MKLRLQNLLPISLWIPLLGSAAVALPVMFGGQSTSVPNVFTSGTPALATEVNANFSSLADRLSAIESQETVITVAATGAEFTSVATAVTEAGTRASFDAPILVRVAPGVYIESVLVLVPPFVHLQGAGPESTIIRGERSGALNTTATGAVLMQANATLSDIRIENLGGGLDVASGVVVSNDSGTSRLRNVSIYVSAPTSNRSIGISLLSARPRIEFCDALAQNSSTFNQGLTASFGSSTAIPIKDSSFTGNGNSQGMGIYLNGSPARIERCNIFGALIGVSVESSGTTRIVDSLIRTTGTSPSLAQSGGSMLECKGVEFDGGVAVGTPSNLRYVHCVRPDLSPVVNGAGSTIN